VSFSALTLFAGRQEGRPLCKKSCSKIPYKNSLLDGEFGITWTVVVVDRQSVVGKDRLTVVDDSSPEIIRWPVACFPCEVGHAIGFRDFSLFNVSSLDQESDLE